ncbi:hypothetical protein DICA1_E11760 [Diutina catenulata]
MYEPGSDGASAGGASAGASASAGAGAGAGAGARAPSAEATRHTEMNHLQSQMKQLETNVAKMAGHIRTMCQQYESIEQMGKLHGAYFMASHRVFESDNFDSEEGKGGRGG